MRLELTLLLLTCNTLQRCRCACNPRKHRTTASPPRKRLDKRACRELALAQHLRSLALARTHYCYALLSHVACVWCPRFRCAALSSFCHVDMWGVSSFRWGDKLSLLEMQLQVCRSFCVYLARARTHMQHARMSSTSTHACANTQIPLSSNLKGFTAAAIPRPQPPTYSTRVFSPRLLTTEKAFGIKPKA